MCSLLNLDRRANGAPTNNADIVPNLTTYIAQ